MMEVRPVDPGRAFLHPRQSVRGHYEIRYGNVIRNGPNLVYWNQSYVFGNGIYTGPSIPIRATLGDGTQVCAYFWRYDGGSNYSGPYGPACETIHK